MPVILRSASSSLKPEPDENLPPRISKRHSQIKRKATDDNGTKEEPVRNVEEIRRKNMEDNKAFLEGLLMTQIRDDIKNLTQALQPSTKRETKKRDQKFITVSEDVPVRRSRRLQQMDVNGEKIPTPEGSDNDMNTTQDTSIIYQRKTYKRLPEISPEEQEVLNKKIREFFEEDFTEIADKTSTYQFSDLTITDENVLKLTPERLIWIDIHSRSDILAVAGCDRKGVVGLVVKSIDDLHGSWCKINYDFHTEYATCCRFDNFNSNIINSTSYDATFRTYDIAKNLSNTIFKDPKEDGLTAFDYGSTRTCLVSVANGDVLQLDLRANPVLINRFDLSKKRIRTLHMNPVRSDEFCISGGDDCVKIWDLRNMSTIKYSLQTNHSCYGAYYNQAASHIMATTRNDYLMLFSCIEMQHAKDPFNVQAIKRIHHRNYVNRFVTPFTAQPYAIFESYFLIGSHDYPRAVKIYDENCKEVSSLISENLNSLATLNISHRTLPIVVAGNSSGRIHVFTGHI